jgi:hypothetical protein
MSVWLDLTRSKRVRLVVLPKIRRRKVFREGCNRVLLRAGRVACDPLGFELLRRHARAICRHRDTRGATTTYCTSEREFIAWFMDALIVNLFQFEVLYRGSSSGIDLESHADLLRLVRRTIRTHPTHGTPTLTLRRTRTVLWSPPSSTPTCRDRPEPARRHHPLDTSPGARLAHAPANSG